MLVFAWILWSIFIVIFLIYVLMFVVGILAIGSGRKTVFKINIFEVLLNIAVFIFLSIYLFG